MKKELTNHWIEERLTSHWIEERLTNHWIEESSMITGLKTKLLDFTGLKTPYTPDRDH